MDKQKPPLLSPVAFLASRIPVGISLVTLAIYASLYLIPFSLDPQNPLWLLLGRFHPLVLHFPIVLILLVTVLFLLDFLKQGFINPLLLRSLLAASVLFSFLSILAGYLLSVSEAYSGPLVSNHYYGALLTGTFLSITAILYERQVHAGKISSALTYVFLLLSNASLAYTSHIGGSLTHGESYLSEPLAALLPAENSLKSPEEMYVYGDVLATILETRCANCHNENKSKGDLLLTSHSALLQAGKSKKKAVVPGDAGSSELLQRVLLPVEDDERMPPEGKPGLTETEIDLLQFWIASGASAELQVGEITNDTILARLEQLMPNIRRAQYKILEENEAFETAQKELQDMAANMGIEILPDELTNNKFFGMKMKFPPAPFGSEELQQFSGYFPYFSRVSLASTEVSDDALFFIGKMTQLRRLVLQKTAITGEGFPYLRDLPVLEELNLSFTSLEDGHLLHLLSFKSLKKVYLFGTPVSMAVIEALRQNRPELEIILEEGPFY
ncbi:c-type cytochrome domain-containing protein [Cyclobacterium xiamenense]|uniref:c-type cytochrome domain-containing protein n=1 Tax=Cyclobacterium xiamenense TaxID=1297121 RepID=UPI0035D0DD56